MRESDIQAKIRIALSQHGARAFNNSVGVAYREKSGETLCHSCMKKLRVIRYGLQVGSSDLIGWVPVTITPEMVGKQVAVFLAHEVKTPRGRPSKEQLNFIEAVTNAGGCAAVVRSEGEALETVEEWISKQQQQNS